MNAQPLTLDAVGDRLFLLVGEVAEILRTDPRTVRRAIEAGDITAVRVSGVVRVPTQTFLAECGLVAPQEEPDSAPAVDDNQERPPAPLRVLPSADPERGPPHGTTPAA